MAAALAAALEFLARTAALELSTERRCRTLIAALPPPSPPPSLTLRSALSPSALAPTHRSILLLGSGYVAAPAADYILRRPENKLTIGMRAHTHTAWSAAL